MGPAIHLESEFEQLCERLGFSVTLKTGAPEATTGPGVMPVGDVEPGTRIDRYLVIRRLGAGAMGVVYAAYDPKLDRKVAIKLLREHGRSSVASARRRLEREAMALAKLAHPNVVAVYDVDVHAGQLFVAMEFVEGQTLGAWLVRPRPWPEVVDKFLAAGRGLAAAHAAGLVHRDFKPENVMLGDDGRVRVMDFGLARGQVIAEIEASPRTDDDAPPLPMPLTQTGTVMGTPAYMALEQFEGRADALSDQFGFCVALYEGLYGQRPFRSESVAQLVRAIASGTREPTPESTEVPNWLHDVVVRGLAADPNRRWPAMAALLDALADDPRKRRRLGPRVLAVALVAGVAASVLVATRDEAKVCEGFEARLAGVWDAEQNQAMKAAFEATGLSYASDSHRGVEQRLDDYTQRWLVARREACEATQQGTQSGELLDMRMRCLDERLEHVAATVELLVAADAEIVHQGVEAVAALPGLERCADIDALRAEVPPPDDDALAERVAALDERLIAAKALERAGKYRPGLELATEVVVEAEALGYEPLQVRAWLTQGSLAQLTGDYADAEASLERAYASALGQAMLVQAEESARRLVDLVGDSMARPEQGRAWLKTAGPLARAVGTLETNTRHLETLAKLEAREGNYADAREHLQEALAIEETNLTPDHPALARTLTQLGEVAHQEGKYQEARECYERALIIREQAFGVEHPLVAMTRRNLGQIAELQANYDEARTHDEHALASLEAALGPNHPEVGATLQSLGRVATSQGDLEGARQYQERALASLEASLGPNHPDLGNVLNSLGILADLRGDVSQAGAYFTRALAIFASALGPDHPKLASALNNLGLVARSEGDHAVARAHFERALAIRERAYGADHPALAISLCSLGDIALAEGEVEAARAYFQRALAIDEQALGPDHPDLAYSLLGLGEAWLSLDAPGEAVPLLERALALRSSQPGIAIELAQTRFVLAQSLWAAPREAGRDRPRARELATLAAVVFEDEGEEEEAESIRAWLVAHKH